MNRASDLLDWAYTVMPKPIVRKASEMPFYDGTKQWVYQPKYDGVRAMVLLFPPGESYAAAVFSKNKTLLSLLKGPIEGFRHLGIHIFDCELCGSTAHVLDKYVDSSDPLSEGYDFQQRLQLTPEGVNSVGELTLRRTPYVLDPTFDELLSLKETSRDLGPVEGIVAKPLSQELSQRLVAYKQKP